MVLRCCVGVVELVVMIESDLLGFLGVEVEVLSWGRVRSEGLHRSIFLFFSFVCVFWISVAERLWGGSLIKEVVVKIFVFSRQFWKINNNNKKYYDYWNFFFLGNKKWVSRVNTSTPCHIYHMSLIRAIARTTFLWVLKQRLLPSSHIHMW